MKVQTIPFKVAEQSFNASAVVLHETVEDWLKWAKERFFTNMKPDLQDTHLREVYRVAQEKVNPPAAPETGKKQPKPAPTDPKKQDA